MRRLRLPARAAAGAACRRAADVEPERPTDGPVRPAPHEDRRDPRHLAARAQDPSRHAADRGRAPRDRRGGHPLQGPDRRPPSRSTRARRSRACSRARAVPPRPSTGAASGWRAGAARALVVNSGNANAFTGLKGREAVALTAEIAAEAAGCPAEIVFLASTGVIGEPLDGPKFRGVLAACAGAGHARRLARRGARHHDHRHLPQGRDAARPARRRRGHDQRHGQGRRHDRARHGDHAVLLLHGRRRSRRRSCRSC